MKVICIDNRGYEKHLTIGKVYTNDGGLYGYLVESDYDGKWLFCYYNNFMLYDDWIVFNRNKVIDEIIF